MMAAMEALDFTGEIWEWRGPAPFYFVTVPEQQSRVLHALSPEISYGWGCIPVTAQIGATEWYTALIPKDGLYVVPVKAKVRRAEGVEVGAIVAVRLTTGGPRSGPPELR